MTESLKFKSRAPMGRPLLSEIQMRPYLGFGIRFLWTSTWDPVHNHFGALQFILGTTITSFCAVLIAAPLSIAIGLFLSELAPRSVRGPIGTLVDMLAAVPSVVVGLWGIYVLAPLLAHHFEPFVHRWLGFIPFFGHPRRAACSRRSSC